MQNANAHSVHLTGAASSLIVDLSGGRRPGRAGAMLTPAAMLCGAAGLAFVWAASPKAPLPALRPAAAVDTPASPRQAAAVQQASLRESQALGRLLADLGSPVQLVRPPALQLTATPADAVAELKTAEAGMVASADQAAQSQLQRLRSTFRAAGLDARPYMAAAAGKPVLSPLELRDPRVLAAKLDIDPSLARSVQHTARDLMAARALGDAEAALPLATPVEDPVRSSPFGTRIDPFTHAAAFHPGQDFAGRYGEAIHVTAPGVVSFVGQRSGYGNCVEVDHGYGFKTRYGHLSGFVVGVGTPVKAGDVIGRMGSTGRSTGVHLHYEVWVSGRLSNPAPFLKAGATPFKG